MARKKRVPTPEIPLSTAGMTTPEALLVRFKDFPAINVIARRFSNPNDPGSLPILLKGASDVVFLTELSVLTKLFYADAMTWFGVTTG